MSKKRGASGGTSSAPGNGDTAKPPAPARSGQGTSTLPRGEHPPIAFAPREPITSLRFFGKRVPPLSLPAAKRLFTIGAGECDLVISTSKRVSSFHAMLERRGPALNVTDQQSKNGTYRSRTDGRLETFQVHAGETFWIADVELLPMDGQLAVLRPKIAECVGLDRDAEIDRILTVVAAPRRRALALVGPTGTGAARLAAAIHQTSPQRNNFFLRIETAPLPSPDLAVGGTIFVDLDGVAKLPAPYLQTLLDPDRGLRVIFAATSDRVMQARLDTFKDVDVIKLVPLATRREDILRLVAIHWIDELHSPRRLDELVGVDKISEHDWPRNLDELYDVSTRLHAYLVHGGLRAAATALGITHQALGKYFHRVGFDPQDGIRRP